MTDPISAHDYIRLGFLTRVLYTTEMCDSKAYYGVVRDTVKLLGDCGFWHSVSACQPFSRLNMANLEGKISGGDVAYFAAVAMSLDNVLREEASDRQTLALEIGAVSSRLRDLPKRLPTGKKLTDAQTEVLNETIRCIECGAYRAAAVMGWNLAYDYVRQWAFDNKLAELNQGLTKVCPTKKQIAAYDDFFEVDAPNERNVLDAMARQDSGPIIGGRLHGHLVQYLDYRNKYAHASEKPASAAKTNAYIEHLIDIITSAPFA